MAKICEICNSRPARYICQECSRAVCEFCFIPERWLCVECYKNIAYPKPFPAFPKVAFSFPFKLLIAGFIITFIGTIILMLSSLYVSSAQAGFIWIFPLPPFFFGIGEGEKWPLTAALTILMIVFTALLVFITYQFVKKTL